MKTLRRLFLISAISLFAAGMMTSCGSKQYCANEHVKYRTNQKIKRTHSSLARSQVKHAAPVRKKWIIRGGSSNVLGHRK